MTTRLCATCGELIVPSDPFDFERPWVHLLKLQDDDHAAEAVYSEAAS